MTAILESEVAIPLAAEPSAELLFSPSEMSGWGSTRKATRFSAPTKAKIVAIPSARRLTDMSLVSPMASGRVVLDHADCLHHGIHGCWANEAKPAQPKFFAERC